MIREEHECLATWHEINQFRAESLPELPAEWQSRWNCLARQFSAINEGEPNFDSSSYDGMLNELEELQLTAKQAAQNTHAMPQKIPTNNNTGALSRLYSRQYSETRR
jgi:hypothetical protein